MKLTKQIKGRADKTTRGDTLLYPRARQRRRVPHPDGDPETLAGEPPPAQSRGWGDMSWARPRP